MKASILASDGEIKQMFTVRPTAHIECAHFLCKGMSLDFIFSLFHVIRQWLEMHFY